MKIAFVYNVGRLKKLHHIVHTDFPSDFFYGALEMEQWGHQIEMFEFRAALPTRFPHFIWSILLYKGCGPTKMDGGLVRQAQDHACTLNGFDCIVATTSGIAFALALCRKRGLITVPIVAIQCGLLNYPYNYLKTFFTGMLLPYLDNIFFGRGELYPVAKKFPSTREQLSVCQYGIDTKFWCKANPGRGNYILSVGNDGRRDFACLLAAAKHISSEIKILTARPMPDTLPDNVTLLRSDWHDQRLTDADLRKLYQEAMCVVLPIVETFQPSGQSVALQAMACGTAVVISETLGFWEPDAYSHGDNILYCKPGNPEDLAEKVNSLLDSKDFMEMVSENGCFTVNENYTIDKFSTCIELHCLKSL